MTDEVPELFVEKLALGELPDDEAQAVRAQLGDDASPRLAAIEASNQEILREHPPERTAAKIDRRLAALDEPPRRQSATRMTMLASAAVLVAALVPIWLLVGSDDPAPSDSPPTIARGIPGGVPGGIPGGVEVGPDGSGHKETVYLKGDAQLIVERVADNRAEMMHEADAAQAGDQLQVSYRAAGSPHGVIVSIDGAGVATLHFPAQPDGTTELAQGGKIPLSTSYELDDAPGFERFFFVTADDDGPIDVDTVLKAAQRLAASPTAERGPLALPTRLRHQSLRLVK